MDKALLPLNRYFDFKGRSTRTEYFAFGIALTLVYAFLLFVMLSTMTRDQGPSGIGMMSLGMMCIVSIGTFVPSIALIVRRLHDQGRTGWMALLMLIPYAGGLIVFIFMCLSGDEGPNLYGEDPRAVGTYSSIY